MAKISSCVDKASFAAYGLSMDCCSTEEKPSSCHPSNNKQSWYSFFRLMVLCACVLYGGHLLNRLYFNIDNKFAHLLHAFYELMNLMSWGIALGIVFVGLLSFVPREYVISVLGKPRTKVGLLRATLAGLLLDLCNHGILMVGMKLYERGASLGQTMAFLIASPWNSFSLTLILWALMGFKWMMVFVILSALIAFVSGMVFDLLENKRILPSNPHQIELAPDFKLWTQLKQDWAAYHFQWEDVGRMLINGFKDSKMIIQWIVFGALLSSVIKTYVPADIFAQYFGPSLLGLGATLVATTLLEVCSEGAAPVAADFMSRAAAPGNSFTFLMAGVSTDYTEIMSLKETTKSWKIALFLPLVTVPQVLIIGYLLNQ
ncbi:MAG TPA: permease [Oligoflexia bacterium]|nr:permease [Oligoflexia bacterium]HMR25603.1 permease [Oligoflexia bacterium]